MAFPTAAPFEHGRPASTAVLLVNLGTPEAPTAPALRRYLAQFLSDRRVIEIPPLIWKLILHGIILRVRPAKSAAKYAAVWTAEGSPLLAWTRKQAQALQASLQGSGMQVQVVPAMRYGQPSVDRALNDLMAQGVQRVLVLPAYPQYSGATTASAFDAVATWGLSQRRLPEFRFINQYHDDPEHISALAQRVRAHWAQHGRPEQLVMSFHGMPERTLHLGDPYHCQCHKTARLLAESLGLAPTQYRVTFQSRFGKAKWLEPSTEPSLIAMAKQGVKHVAVVCPGFSADCLETLEEIQMEAKAAFLDAGGQRFDYIPCLNDAPEGIAAWHSLCVNHLQGWPLFSADLPTQSALANSRDRALAMGATS